MTNLPYWVEPDLDTDEPALVLPFSRRRARHLIGDEEMWKLQIKLQALLGAIAELRRGPRSVQKEHVANAADVADTVAAIRDELTLAYAAQPDVSVEKAGEPLGMGKSSAQARIAAARRAHDERAWIGASPNPTPGIHSVRIAVAPGEALVIGEQEYRLPPGAEMSIDRFADKVTIHADRLGRMTVSGWGWVTEDAEAGTVTLHTESGRDYTTRPTPGGVRVT
jgi:hypothetical protein